MKWMMAALAAFFMSATFVVEAGQTPCDEWANFTKIITYRFRDVGLPRELVKDELKKTMGKNPEIDVANGWIDYAYDHPEKSPVEVWKDVYGMCGAVGI